MGSIKKPILFPNLGREKEWWFMHINYFARLRGDPYAMCITIDRLILWLKRRFLDLRLVMFRLRIGNDRLLDDLPNEVHPRDWPEVGKFLGGPLSYILAGLKPNRSAREIHFDDFLDDFGDVFRCLDLALKLVSVINEDNNKNNSNEGCALICAYLSSA